MGVDGEDQDEIWKFGNVFLSSSGDVGLFAPIIFHECIDIHNHIYIYIYHQSPYQKKCINSPLFLIRLLRFRNQDKVDPLDAKDDIDSDLVALLFLIL